LIVPPDSREIFTYFPSSDIEKTAGMDKKQITEDILIIFFN